MHLTPPRHIPVDGLALHPARPAYTSIHCPKCGNSSLTFEEQWKTAISFQVTNGWMDRANGNMDCNGGAGGTPTKVVAICTCGHEWTVRKARRIDDVCEEIGS